MLRWVVGFAVVTLVLAEQKAVVTFIGGVSGSVYFTKTNDGILINGNISGLTPGKHGFHVHAVGDLSGGCATTLGHFNPLNVSHGAPANDKDHRHIGDLGNIVADANGVATINFVDKLIALDGAYNIIGRGVVVHADEDDLGKGNFSDSLTTGHAGARVACGVIGTLAESGADSLLSWVPGVIISAVLVLRRVL